MTTLLVSFLVGCQRAPLPSSWVEARGTVTRMERVVADQPLPWPVATAEWTEMDLSPVLTDTTRRFEQTFGYAFREETRNRVRHPRIQADDTIRFGFRKAPETAIQVGVEVIVCWDVANGGGAVWPAESERTCADDSKAAALSP